METSFYEVLTKKQLKYIVEQLDENTANEFLDSLKYVAKERKSFQKLNREYKARLRKDNLYIHYYFERDKVYELSIYPYYIYEERQYDRSECETSKEYKERYNYCQKIFDKYANKDLIKEKDVDVSKYIIEA